MRSPPARIRRQRSAPSWPGLMLAGGVVLAVLLSLDWHPRFDRLARPATPAPASEAERVVARAAIRVIDGDTIDLAGRRIRLVGFNAPETFEPGCAREAEAGARSKARLRQLVAGGRLSYRPVACSCPPGTEGTLSCNHGRHCGTLLADGRDVGEILVSEDLAVPFACGPTRCPRMPRPWCEQMRSAPQG